MLSMVLRKAYPFQKILKELKSLFLSSPPQLVQITHARIPPSENRDLGLLRRGRIINRP